MTNIISAVQFTLFSASGICPLNIFMPGVYTEWGSALLLCNLYSWNDAFKQSENKTIEQGILEGNLDICFPSNVSGYVK
jgi:hypothetical protein